MKNRCSGQTHPNSGSFLCNYPAISRRQVAADRGGHLSGSNGFIRQRHDPCDPRARHGRERAQVPRGGLAFALGQAERMLRAVGRDMAVYKRVHAHHAPQAGIPAQVTAETLAVPVVTEEIVQQRRADNRGGLVSGQTHPAGDGIRRLSHGVGSGGKVINKIIEETGVKIDIDDDGKVCIATYGENLDNAERAKAIILSIARDPEVGDMFIGSVVRILSKVGAFVELAPGKDGMIHISKMSDKRINQVEDVLNIGDTVKVEIIKIGEKGIDLKLLEKMEG